LEGYYIKERPANILEVWDGPQIIRDEIVKLETLLEKVIKKFEQQNSELISLHEEEINVLSIESLLTS
jgi:hypothetical protein